MGAASWASRLSCRTSKGMSLCLPGWPPPLLLRFHCLPVHAGLAPRLLTVGGEGAVGHHLRAHMKATEPLFVPI